MAEVNQPPQTRYTPDQNAIAETTVQYPGLRPEDPAGTLKIVGWGNMAQEVQQLCQPGQWLIFEGRLRMNTIERPEGFKEKQVELSVSKVYPMGSALAPASAPAVAAPAIPQVSPSRKVPAMAGADAGGGAGGGMAVAAPDYADDIPF
jgi:single-strand DNA-binding protein